MKEGPRAYLKSNTQLEPHSRIDHANEMHCTGNRRSERASLIYRARSRDTSPLPSPRIVEARTRGGFAAPLQGACEAMLKRYFEHVYSEISVAAGRRVSRYDLWLAIWSAGEDPDDLNQKQVRCFLDSELDDFLREEGLALAPRARKRLEKRLLRFNPDYPTPEECFSRLLTRTQEAA